MFIDSDADSPADTDRMLVDPDKLERLKKGLEDEVGVIRDWLRVNIKQLTWIEPPGLDPCSQDTVKVMGQHGAVAVDKSQAYLARLQMVAEKLHESAVAYGATDDHNAAAFRPGTR
jgi:division protein CdvB (Snf7/Vps24/ESCRT-III family)